MSNSLAVAITTETLRSLLDHGIRSRDQGLGDLEVTTDPLDVARTGGKPQLNIFLYQTAVNAAWRNLDPPRPPKSGGTGFPPLALNLFYLLTAYGRGHHDKDAWSHRVLGGAMSVLHDHPLLGAEEIRNVKPDKDPRNDLADQIERIRFTLHPCPVDEISKLWTAFQTHYRLSAVYEATVVLIDSTRPTVSALPVLARGPNDDSPSVGASLRPYYPTIFSIEHETETAQPSFQLGDQITIRGANLDGTNVAVELQHTRQALPQTLVPSEATETAVTAVLPNDPSWPAGVYGVAVAVQRPGDDFQRHTNEIPITMAPRIRAFAKSLVKSTADGTVTLTVTVTCHPNVRPGQRVVLILGDHEIAAEPFANPTEAPVFHLLAVRPGSYFLRLRVDGVDSLLVASYAKKPWQFDTAQQLTVP